MLLYGSGNWKLGRKSGEGKYFYPNGDVYSGKWAYDKRNGSGIYTYKVDGSQMICKFESGQLVMGEWLIPNGSALRLCYTDGKPAVRKPSNINIGHKVNFRETKNVCFFLSLFFFWGGGGGGGKQGQRAYYIAATENCIQGSFNEEGTWETLSTTPGNMGTFKELQPEAVVA